MAQPLLGGAIGNTVTEAESEHNAVDMYSHNAVDLYSIMSYTCKSPPGSIYPEV